MQVCFLTPGLPAPGDPIGEHARRLAASGTEVTVALTEGVPPGADAVPFGDATAVPVAALAGRRFDIAIASHWRATAELFAVAAERHAFWVDGLAFRAMGSWQAERFAAQLAYDLPVDFIAAGNWLQAELAELRPDARCLVVPNGVEKATFAPLLEDPGNDGPLRVVVDDRHVNGTSPERAVVPEVTAAVDFIDLETGDDAPLRAAKLAGAHVVLMLSPVDGALRGPLEGFHTGATCVVASAADAADLVRHDVNGIVTDPDDTRGAARWLDRLAQDRELLTRLRAGARETAEAWPSAEEAAERFDAVLRELVTEPPPAQAQWPVRLMGDAIGGAAVFKQEIGALTGEVHRLQGDQAYRTAVKVREKWHGARLGPVRRLAGPLLRRAKSRVSG